MTGTNCDLFTHNQSRSYLNHLVLGLSRKRRYDLRDSDVFTARCEYLPAQLQRSSRNVGLLVCYALAV